MSPRWRLTCGWITMFVVGTDLFVISPLLPLIAGDFGLSAATAGLSVTAFSLTYLLSAPFIGYVADRFGRRRTLLTCLFAFALTNLLTGAAPGFGWLLAVRAAAGIATAGVSPLIYAGVGEAAPPARRATWMAIAVSGLLLSLSAGAPVGTLVAASLGWRAPFIILAALSVLLMVANRAVWPARPAGPGPGAAGLPPVNAAAMAVRLLPTVLWATALYSVYTYLGVWLTGAGLSPFEIARAIGCYGAGALAGTLIGGRLADRFGTFKTMLASLGGQTVCLLILVGGIGTGLAADAMLLVLSVFAQFFFPAQQARLTRVFPERRAMVLALNNSGLFTGISAGSLIGGEAIARAGFGADAAIAALIACAGLIVIARGDRG